jgi:hypothetical protein
MIDLSFPGLIGAIIGTIVAAAVYHLFIGILEQAMRPREQAADRDTGDVSLSVVRRLVLTVDLLAFAALGYWLGRMFDK